MKLLEWLLHLLEGNLDNAHSMLMRENMRDPANIINLLAISFLKKDFDQIKEISQVIFEKKRNFGEESILRILEYRILADIATSDAADLLNSLRFIRPKLLMFIAKMAPPIVISSVKDLLNEQTLMLLRRLRQITIEDYDPYAISGIVCKAVLEAMQNGFFDKLDKKEQAEALAYAAMLLLSISKVDIARKILKRSLSLHEFYVNRCALGKLYFVMGNLAQSFSELNYALNFSGSDRYKGFEAKTNIAQLYAIQGEYKMALRYIVDALRIRQDPFVRMIRGEILMNLGRYKDAIYAFKAVLSSQTERLKTYTLINLAICYLERKALKKAFDSLWKALLLNPKNENLMLITKTIKALAEKSKR